MSAIPNVPQSVAHVASAGIDGSKPNGSMHVQENGISLKRPWKLNNAAVENHRSIRVIVIGAGFSGIYCGIRIPERIRNCELTIYEKNAGYGGAWYENRYPGCACDVPCKDLCYRT